MRQLILLLLLTGSVSALTCPESCQVAGHTRGTCEYLTDGCSSTTSVGCSLGMTCCCTDPVCTDYDHGINHDTNSGCVDETGTYYDECVAVEIGWGIYDSVSHDYYCSNGRCEMSALTCLLECAWSYGVCEEYLLVSTTTTTTTTTTIHATTTSSTTTTPTSSTSSTTTSITTTSTSSTSTTTPATTSSSTIKTSTSSTTSSTTTTAPDCPTPGDHPPCGTISLSEVVDYIQLWAYGQASLPDVIDLINQWATT